MVAATAGKKKPQSKLGKIKKKLDKVVREIQGNLGHKDANGNLSVDNVLTNNILLYQLDQGDQPYEREGNSITPTSIRFRYYLTCSAAATAAQSQGCRVLVVQAVGRYDGTGATQNIGQVLQNATGAPEQWVNVPKNDNTEYQFNVLYDKTHRLVADQGCALGYSQPKTVIISGSKMKPVTYSGPTAASMATNPIYVMLVGEIPVGAADKPRITYYLRQYFHK